MKPDFCTQSFFTSDSDPTSGLTLRAVIAKSRSYFRYVPKLSIQGRRRFVC